VSGIARIGQKINAALPTAGQAPSPVRLALQHRSHELVVLQDELPYARAAIPVLSVIEMLRDRDCKKPKLLLRMLKVD
jgi:hypothetical protein